MGSGKRKTRKVTQRIQRLTSALPSLGHRDLEGAGGQRMHWDWHGFLQMGETGRKEEEKSEQGKRNFVGRRHCSRRPGGGGWKREEGEERQR